MPTRKSSQTSTKKIKKSQKSKKIWLFAICTATPLILGMFSSFVSKDGISTFSSLKQPPLAPPAWLFPIAWSILYLAMGLASAFIFNMKKSFPRNTLAGAYLIQLFLNIIWCPIFFLAGNYLIALIVLGVMWALVLYLLIGTFQDNRPAFWLLLPYLVWLTFAAYLNTGVLILN